MVATGVDIIEVDRVRRGLERYGRRFTDRFFTAREQEQCGGRVTSLAGRYAVKEAVSKALGTGIGDIQWKDVEVISDERGRPHLALHGAARRLAAEMGLQDWSISLSHTPTHAIGLAVAVRRDTGEPATDAPASVKSQPHGQSDDNVVSEESA